MMHLVLIAIVLLLLNLCWLSISLARRVRSLEMLAGDQERRLQLLELVAPRLVRVGVSDLTTSRSDSRSERSPDASTRS